MKYSKLTAVVSWSQGIIMLTEGMTADDAHPLVRERPDLFHDEPPRAVLFVANRPEPEQDPDQDPDQDPEQEPEQEPEPTPDPEPTKEAPVIERATRGPGERSPARDTSKPAPRKATPASKTDDKPATPTKK